MDARDWNTGKRNHLRLADDAASTYDTEYAQSAFATRCYMEFEEVALQDAAHEAPAHRLALDLGCGTGRLAFVMASAFERVWGCDISPAMIRQARANAGSQSNLRFTAFDVEQSPLPFNINSVDMVNAGFGMFSFVNDPQAFVSEVQRVLRDDGLFILSCYNSGALRLPTDTPWAPALHARIEDDSLVVSHHKKTFSINAHDYSPVQIRELLEIAFEVESIVSLPTLASVLPEDFVTYPRIRALCTAVDAAVAFREDLAAGAYLWVRARKRSCTEDHGKSVRKTFPSTTVR